MSYLNRRRLWHLTVGGGGLRNNQTTFLYGNSGGTDGFRFDRRGLATRLTVQGDVTGITGSAGTPWTVTFTVYKDGITSSDDVFEVQFTGNTTASAAVSGTTTTVLSASADFGTGSDWFVKAVSALGSFSTLSMTYGLVLEGIYVD